MLPVFLLAIGVAKAAEVLRFTRNFTNVYAICGSESVVLVDAHNKGEEDWIAAQLRRHGRSLDDVTLTVLTHAHSDHAGSAAALQGQGIPIAVGAGDVHMTEAGVHDDLAPTDWRGAIIQRTVDPAYPAFSADIVVSESMSLAPYGVAATVRSVGGHTPGSLVVVLDDGRVLSGDLIRGGFIRRKKPTLHFFQTDLDVAHQTVSALLDEGAPALLAAHGKALKAARLHRWLARHASE